MQISFYFFSNYWAYLFAIGFIIGVLVAHNQKLQHNKNA